MRQLLLVLISILIICPVFLMAQITATFQVDMNGTEFEKGWPIGLRGSMDPLSWTKSLEMTDPDNDGIYSLTLDFEKCKPGDRINYKYLAGDNWDLDQYGPYGNRVVILLDYPYNTYTARWNKIDEFSLDSKLELSRNNEEKLWLFIIADGRYNGLSLEESISTYYKFWGDYSWMQNPMNLMHEAQLNQSLCQDGYFEEIQKSPEKVVFNIRKNASTMIQNWGRDGELFGISQDDMNKIQKLWYKTICDFKGWKFTWEDSGIDAKITISTNRYPD